MLIVLGADLEDIHGGKGYKKCVNSAIPKVTLYLVNVLSTLNLIVFSVHMLVLSLCVQQRQLYIL